MAGSAAARLLIAASVLVNAVMPASVGIARAEVPDRDAMTVSLKAKDVWPPKAVTDLEGLSGAEGQAYLEWTAPVESDVLSPSPVPPVQYLIRLATFSVTELAGDTTAWFDAATPVAAPPPLTPGTRQALLTSLDYGARYYFGMKSVDDMGLTSTIDSKTASGAGQAKVDVVGVAGVTDLKAVPGSDTGSIDLTWTTPRRVGQLDPVRYDVRVSSLAQISNSGQFNAAKPLTAFSLSTVPLPGPAGSPAAFTVTGLVASATYYFAVRAADSGTPPFIGPWNRNEATGVNVSNFSRSKFTPGLPDAVTNLAAFYGEYPGDIMVTWSAPQNANQVPIDRYILKVSSRSVQELGGDAEAWFSLAESTTILRSGLPPGTTVAVNITGFYGDEMGKTFYFGVKSVDIAQEVSPIDTRAASVADQAKSKPKPTPPIINLTAVTGTQAGSVDLTWTEPDNTGAMLPLAYVIHVSTTGNIEDNDDFDAAKPLTAFSPSPVPVPGAGGAVVAMTVTGLIPNATYYFAIREYDSHPLPIVSDWLRDLARAVNVNNHAPARFLFRLPDPITDLTALTAAQEGRVDLSWTAPRNQNFVPVSTYTVRLATFSAAAVGGDGQRWFDLAPDERVLAPAQAPGSLETLTVTGLVPGVFYFFGVKSLDRESELSLVDVRSQGVADQAGAASKGVGPVTALAARADPANSFGGVELSWTEPGRAGATPPLRYVVKASSAANISTDAEFESATPVTELSGTLLPDVGAAGAVRVWVVTGLTPFTTYYFAVRAEDSSAPSMKGLWLRDAWRGLNVFNFAAPRFVPNDPEPVTDLAAAPGTAAEGDVTLSWTAPLNRNFVPISRYELRYSTRSITDLAGDAALWYQLADRAAKPSAGAPGMLENLTLNGLYPASTFYFAVKSVDLASEVSPIDTEAATPGAQAFAKPLNLPPAAPSGLAAEAGLIQVALRWDELPAGLGGKGLDFVHYFLQRSTEAAAGFVEFSTTTAVTYLDRPLDAFTTFYFRVGARDAEGLASASPAVKATPFTIRPMEPFSFDFSRAADTVTLRWKPTLRFSDATLFISTASPRADELTGYEVYVTTDPCVPFTLAQSSGVAADSFTHDTHGRAYFYMLRSSNTWLASKDSVLVTQLGDLYFGLDDCRSAVLVDGVQAPLLTSEVTGLSEDVAIMRQRLPEETGDKVLASAEFKPMLGGYAELKDFHFPQPVTVRLRYPTDADGMPVAPASGMGPAAAPRTAKDLGMFWHNGTEYKKLYGKVNTTEQVVEAQTPNLGKFQVRIMLRESGVTFDLSNLTSRVLTPNGDGKNDVVIFTFDNPNGSPVEGKIYDMRGAYVADMIPGTARGLTAGQLVWDGMMNGKPVTSGVYVYQVEAEGKVFNGTLVVAR
jgi:hypothetical protein